ncbi:outer dynein arm-docking complex subunit 3-like isoform X2 [Tachysurus fulvidraco]|uniref:outer dynein arm-docking complex subunit 3-like isoform X2 n=1 Tax=Tachysurus fulvidraco TaxID=1234273 RepID=UPI001FEDA3B4|nr:outer dynein arm-docking complex subunit 3-like isoform X2 [Tachysurus fulvidraco]
MSETFSSKEMRAPIYKEISEIQRKIQLLEGEKSAQSQSSQCLIQRNKEKIMQLRHDIQLQHRKLAEALSADEQVIRDAFQSHNSELAAYRNMSGKAAVQALDQKVSEKMKKLNVLKHMTNIQRHRLEELNTLRTTRPGLPTDGVATNLHMLYLQNQLEKAQLKCQESEHMVRSFQAIKEHLQEESLTFQSQLDELEGEIVQKKQELRDLQLMYTRTYQAESSAKAQKVVLHTGELCSEAQCIVTGGGEHNRTISSFKEAFKRITETTGDTNTQEVVDRFISQCDTHTHMEKMKEQNEHEIQQLMEERVALYNQYQDLKYSGDTKLIQRSLVEELVSQLQQEKQEQDAAKETLERLTHKLNTLSNAVEHTCHKLDHITQQDAPVQPERAYPLHALNMLLEAELKLIQLQEELQGHDIESVIKEMMDQEFHAKDEGKLPDFSTSITQPEYQRADSHEKEDDNEDDDCEDLHLDVP